MAIVAGDAPDIRDEWGKYRNDDIAGAAQSFAIPPFSALSWRYKLSHQALIAKTAEGIAQRGLYDLYMQAKKHFSAK
jgi:hypothetical protein